ncbi:hypothetical protein F4821DRAFT_152442 [Hypoxylon rubiginosum]|uniref:Uncharacterized protein n=1 Tax=Hypoxylon rubiginosum TaxID=110542 RepID=A0ACC0CY19_9PEZI|nr:hypothetical protein F4821DRAFT_152442 [Hypoxylon rubiginosum]
MGEFFESIPKESLIKWIQAQKVFWVATAPLSGNGHVNVSPKGQVSANHKSFGVTPDRLPEKDAPNDKQQQMFWYMEMTGSGIETISHLLEPGNGRITIQFNEFQKEPRILRLWGKGRVLEFGTAAFDDMVERENIEVIPGVRSIIVVDIHQVGTSCGYSVPLYEFKGFRTTLPDFFRRKEERFLAGSEKDSMPRYWALKSAWSMDGLPGMPTGLKTGREFAIEPMRKMVGPWAPKGRGGPGARGGFQIEHVIIMVLAALLAISVATHPAFQHHAQTRMQEVMMQIRSVPEALPSSIRLRD